jgi:ABC-2 type transport system permease protein
MILAEWLKLRSVRTTWYLLGLATLAIAAGAGISWMGANAYDHAANSHVHVSMASVAQIVGWFVELLMAILGALAITAEYRSGTITTSIIAVPRRWPMLAGKVTAVAGLTLFVGEVAVFAGYVEGRAIVGDRPILLDAGPFGHQVPLLVAEGLLPMMFALIGLGLGVVLRSAAGTITCLALLWYPLPIVANQLPEPWHERVASIIPDALPGQLAHAGNAHSIYGDALPPWAAGLVVVLYIAVPLAAAVLLLRHRDVGR